MPIISVIVPIYKVEKYIRRCVDSILNQSFRDFELILVDDGSPDNCGNICEEYKQKDSRVVVIHQKNEGLSSARNTGIEWALKNSKSIWISFVDSDDWIHHEMLERLFRAVIENKVDMSVCSYRKVESVLPEFHEELLNVKMMDSESFYRQYGVNATVAWGKLYKKEIFKELRYPVGKYHEDEFVTYKIIFLIKKIAMIEAPLYAYYINPDSIMSNWNPKRLDSMDAIRERILYFEELGLQELKREQEKAYIWNIVNHIKQIEQSDVSIREQYENQLRNILRKELWKYRKQISFRENKWFYETAYPKLMRYYWMISKILKR